MNYAIKEGKRPNPGYTIEATYKNLTVKAVFKGDKTADWGNGTTNNRNYKVTVTNTETSAKAKFDFWSSISHPKLEKDYDVLNALYCFVSDAVSGDQTFEDFCGELGYDTDSISAKKTWKACKKQLEKLGSIYDGDIYDLVNELSEVAG